jgi:hypothetical protein
MALLPKVTLPLSAAKQLSPWICAKISFLLANKKGTKLK